MPIYEYQCEKCKEIISVLIPKEKLPAKCKCGGSFKKKMSKGNFKI